MWIVIIDKAVVNEVYISLLDACKVANVSYQMACRGKRIFKGVELIECSIVKSGKVGKFLSNQGEQEQLQKSWRKDISYDDSI